MDRKRQYKEAFDSIRKEALQFDVEDDESESSTSTFKVPAARPPPRVIRRRRPSNFRTSDVSTLPPTRPIFSTSTPRSSTSSQARIFSPSVSFIPPPNAVRGARSGIGSRPGSSRDVATSRPRSPSPNPTSSQARSRSPSVVFVPPPPPPAVRGARGGRGSRRGRGSRGARGTIGMRRDTFVVPQPYRHRSAKEKKSR